VRGGCRTGAFSASISTSSIAVTELEFLRRSVAMLAPRAQTLSREEALWLRTELGDVEQRLARLCSELRRVAEE
jgi:hypothetical protein